MRELTTNNYEEWALDFLEGKLSESEQKLFNTYLLLNPEIAAELDLMKDGIEEVTAITEEKLDSKEQLKSTLPAHLASQSWDDLMIAVLENDLPEKEKNLLLSEFERNPGLEKEWRLFQLTKIPATAEISPLDKRKLYRKPAGKIIAISRPVLYRAAAIIILFGVGVSLWFRDNIEFQPREKQFSMNSMPVMDEAETIELNPSTSIALKELSTPDNTPVKESSRVVANHTQSKISERIIPLERIGPKSVSYLTLAENSPVANAAMEYRSLMEIETPGTALASTTRKQNVDNGQYFDLTKPGKSLAQWVKLQGSKKLNLSEDQLLEVPGSVEYASAGAALLERLTGRTFALEPKFSEDGKMNDLSLRAGNYQLMLK